MLREAQMAAGVSHRGMGARYPTMTAANANRSTPGPDAASRAWVEALSAGDEEARRRLHGLLLSAARFEISPSRP